MSVLEILLWPDARLSQPCAPVEEGEDLALLVADMFETMYAAPGRGLAAPQVGVMKRLFVMDVGWKEGTPAPLVCINPEVLSLSDAEETQAEGCLSIPGAPAEVTRPVSAKLAWSDLSGQRHSREMTGWEARCALHEFDHLEGRVIFDRLAEAARANVEAAYLAARGA